MDEIEDLIDAETDLHRLTNEESLNLKKQYNEATVEMKDAERDFLIKKAAALKDLQPIV